MSEPPHNANIMAQLAAIYKGIDKTPLQIVDDQDPSTKLVNYNIFGDVLGQRNFPNLIEIITKESPGADRAVGCLVGCALGDSLGQPLEFLDANSSVVTLYDTRRPCLRPGAGVQYNAPLNTFRLKAGQWTDDCSMALCLADSILVYPTYNGGDARIRWQNWWMSGYNNTFRFDHPQRPSVGLGGNIAKSLRELVAHAGKTPSRVPPVYSGTGDDSGNGSLMRLAPVPIAYHNSEYLSLHIAKQQSLATHPGKDASACCQFMAFCIYRALHHKTLHPDPKLFLDETVIQFMAGHNMNSDSGMQRLQRLLMADEPHTSTEYVWCWRNTRLPIEETVLLRGQRYNGHPVSAAYFGSYCMDGLSMALWALYGAKSFEGAIYRVVNLLGDADTTGAICGQIAGALFGYRTIIATTIGSEWVANLYQWDPHMEIPMRAILLYYLQLFRQTEVHNRVNKRKLIS